MESYREALAVIVMVLMAFTYFNGLVIDKYNATVKSKWKRVGNAVLMIVPALCVYALVHILIITSPN